MVERTAPAISVVIVNWNSGDELARCLESIATTAPASVREVIVVDNASSDDSVATACSIARGTRWILNRTNRGLAAANNQGLLASTGDCVVFTNPDVLFQPDAFNALVSCLGRHPDAAFVVPRVEYPDGALQTTAGDLPTLTEALLGRQHQRRKSRFGEAAGFCWDGWPHDEERLVGRAGDVCYGARREALLTIGLLDEGFPLAWEAIDWSARARALGWSIWFCPDAALVHAADTSTSNASRARWVLMTHHGMYRYFAKRRVTAWHPLLAAAFAIRGAVKIAAMSSGAPPDERARRGDRPW